MSEWPKETTYKDVPALEYENGLILNQDTKRIMRPADNTLFKVNGDNDPVSALETKKELAIQAAMRALADGEDASSLADRALLGWETVTKAQKRLALDTGKGHASTRAAEFVGKATGMLPDKQQMRARTADGVGIDGPPEEVRAVIQMLISERDRRSGA